MKRRWSTIHIIPIPLGELLKKKPQPATSVTATKSIMFKNRRHRRDSSSSSCTGTTSSSSCSAKQITIEDLSEQLIPITGSNRFVIYLHNLLTPEECTNLIRRAEDEGFDDALVQDPNGKQILRRDIRSCGRCIIDDVDLAAAIYTRILNAVRGTNSEKKVMHAPWVTSSEKRRASCEDQGNANNNGETTILHAVGLNERMRFLKYQPGHFFAPHQDIRFVRGPDAGSRAGETSHVTVQLYLNEKFKGGTTRFLCGKRHYDVKPRIGSALIFDHNLLHEGSKVIGGIKYSVRTDIMFAATAPAATSDMRKREYDPREESRRRSAP